MVKIRTDQRCIEGDPRPTVHRRLVEHQPMWLERDLQRARDFDEIRSSGHYRLERCATIAEYGEKLGYDGRQVRRWANVGLVLRAEPKIEELLLVGGLSLEKAEILAPIYRMEARQWEGDDWIALAGYCTPRELRRHVQRRIEEVAHGKTCQSRTISAPDDVWNDFARARDVASSRAGRPVTQGETLGIALTEYLDRKDPLRKAERAAKRRGRGKKKGIGQRRRKPGGKEPRKPPADVEYMVWLRARGECEYPGCRCRRGLQLAHVQPYASGAPHDVRNGVLLCPSHHTHFDAGTVDLLGWSEDGKPIFDARDPKSRAPP